MESQGELGQIPEPSMVVSDQRRKGSGNCPYLQNPSPN
jgi:hypothetical protein